jgi:hypothetical protein
MPKGIKTACCCDDCAQSKAPPITAGALRHTRLWTMAPSDNAKFNPNAGAGAALLSHAVQHELANSPRSAA